MINNTMKYRKHFTLSLIALSLLVGILLISATKKAAVALAKPLSDKMVIIDTFEHGLPSGKDNSGTPKPIQIGFYTFQDGSPTTTLAVTTTTTLPAPVPGVITTPNHALKLEANVASFAGLIHGFETPAVDGWVSQDWSHFEGISFWLYGNNSGTNLFIDLIDNRNPGSTVDDGERFSLTFVDDFTGWKHLHFPFTQFSRKEIGNGAPNDGLTLTEMHGWAIGTVSTPSPQTFYMDQLALTVREVIIDDFEAGLPKGTDSHNVPLGFTTFSDGSPIAITTTNSLSNAYPGAAITNTIMKMDSNVDGFAGFAHNFENSSLDGWTPQNWSSFEGVSFWLYGAGNGAMLSFDVIENRNPNSTTDDAERHSVSFKDDTLGWKQLTFKFDDFARKEIGNGAPNDGFTRQEVHGYAFLSLASNGPQTQYLDKVTIYGNNRSDAPREVRYAANAIKVTEGNTATVTVKLTRSADKIVMVDYATSPNTDRQNTEDLIATPNRDYMAVTGTLTFPPGSMEQSFMVETLDDDKWEVNETVLLTLSNAVGADFGKLATRASLVIVDNDARDLTLLDDFEHFPYKFKTTGAVILNVTEVPTNTPSALPKQGAYENVLEATGAGSFYHHFEQGQDWSKANGISLWFEGQNSGQSIGLKLLDNRAADSGPDGWQLVWSDEFSGAAGTPANPANWTYESGGWGWGNDEFQYYTDSPNNAAHDGNGNLILTVRKVVTPAAEALPCWYGDCTHTSARLISEGKQEFTYGRIEARAKVPQGTGIWPAVWSLGNDFRDVGWPQTGEIDVMEFVGRLPNEIFGTIHGPGYSGGQAWFGKTDIGEGVFNNYHTFTVDWQPNQIKWYIDGKNYHTATPKNIAPNKWVFDHPFFLLLNVAVGGNFGGPLGDDLTFPAELAVDYIRVYQAPDTAERFEATFTDTFTGWQNITIPFTDFSRAADQPTDAPNDGLGLEKVWGYGLSVDGTNPIKLDQVRLIRDTPTTKLPLVDGFEYDTLPQGKDANGLDVGLIAWGENASEIVLSTEAVSGDMAVPGQADGNRVLKVQAGTFGGWGGFTHAFENRDLNQWVSQDWTAYQAGHVCFWFKGTNSGKQMHLELFDNRTPNSTVDDAERWEYGWTDNMTGWQSINIPVADFVRRADWQPNGAPDDGLGLSNIYGYAIRIPTAGTYYLDGFILSADGNCPSGGTKPKGNNLTLNDFEFDKIPLGKDAADTEIGLTTWSDSGSSAVVLSTLVGSGNLAVPEQSAGNRILKIKADFGAWGGFTEAFANEALDTWITKDLTPYRQGGLCFWFYGTNSEKTIFTEIFDNRNPDQPGDTAERWEHGWTDNFEGWKQIDIPFSDFARRTDWQPGGSPNDDLGLNQAHGYAIRLAVAGTYYIDDVVVYDTECPGSSSGGGGKLTFLNIDDFQSGVPDEMIAWGGGASPNMSTIQMDVPDQPSGTNNVLHITYDITGFGGITHGFSKAQDWSRYDGIRFWFKGTNSGLQKIRFEVKDGGSGGEANAEIFLIYINDDSEEWREFVLPWSKFTRREDWQPAGAPTDGVLELKEIWGYAVGVDAEKAQGEWWLDNVALYGTSSGGGGGGDTPATLSFAKALATVTEGNTATLQVVLNVTTTKTISVTYMTSDIETRNGIRAVDDKAVAGIDYRPVSGTLIFEAGSPAGSSQTIMIKTLADDKPEVGEAIRVTLSDITNAQFGAYKTVELYISAHGLPYLNPSLPVSQRVNDLVSRMTIQEKAGQMTQIQHLALAQTPEKIAEYKLGSLLSGGGGWPSRGNLPKDWADLYDNYQSYALATRLGIPLIYGVDAVHGHSNVYGATYFPHNIGLGATRNPTLVEEVGRVTAVEVAATGIDWTFSPCLCVARDQRWGRTYESFGEHPEIASMMAPIIRGYQGTDLSARDTILATAKHFVGDGGTTDGDDQGNTELTEQTLRDIHVAPFVSAIKLDVATVMPSFSSWNGVKMHGNKYLLNDVLREEMGFKGFLISDWAGIDQIPGNYNSDVRTSVNAGMDLVMVPGDYQRFTTVLIEEIVAGNIPMSRIDDAVSLILTKKFELGLFEQPLTDRTNIDKFGSAEHRAVARQAVAESLVLLKNEKNVLPLDASRNLNILVAGSSADDLGNQLGGWSISWQGASGKTTIGTTIKEAIEKYAADKPVSMTFNPTAEGVLAGDVGIVVVGETPYAEGSGDATEAKDLELTAKDKAVVQTVCSAMDCVVILISGRPMLVGNEIDQSTAFVAAWLPGSEGDGVADVLFGDKPFTGKLPMTWVDTFEQIPMNVGDQNYNPRFAYGFGLTYETSGIIPTSGVNNLSLIGGGAITVPANTFNEEVTLRYTPVGPKPVGTLGHVGVFYDIEFRNSAGNVVQPTGSYTIQLAYDDSGIPARISETELGLYYQDEANSWLEAKNCQVDTTNNRLTCTVNHASLWAILFVDTANSSTVYLPVMTK